MRWYQTAWGIALLGLGGLVIAAVGIFAFFTVKFWWQIRQGKGELLLQQYNGFDKDPTATLGKIEQVDRKVLENGDFPFLGNPNAPITIVMFGDFRCPNTKNAWPVLQRLVGQYGQKVKLVYRQFPIESIPSHRGTNKLSQISMCAYKQSPGNYWAVHTYLFATQNSLPTFLGATDLATLADETGLDLIKLNDCLNSNNPVELTKINVDYRDALQFGVAGTPTFFVNGKKIEGVVPWEAWEGFVKQF